MKIFTEIETETVPCKWCDGDGLVVGVSGQYHTEIPCVYCNGLGALTREYERKYIVLPDGQKELL
jgi:DnaJ-class molecular chaperone